MNEFPRPVAVPPVKYVPAPHPGWVCPHCSAAYAPWVPECRRCNDGPVRIDVPPTTDEQRAAVQKYLNH